MPLVGFYNNYMEDPIEFLDWLVRLQINHYPTEKTADYNPSGESHFYLSRSPERFTSKEMIELWNNTANKELNTRWNYAITDNR